MAALGKYFIVTALWLCSMFATSQQERSFSNEEERFDYLCSAKFHFIVKNHILLSECNNRNGYLIDAKGRDLILTIHNEKRVATAKGQYRNGRNNFNIRHAKNMMEMKYDCDLEAEAHAIATACPEKETSQTTLTAQGENFFKIDEEYEKVGSASNALYRAGTAWFEEITKNGINQNIDFTQYFANKKPTVYHWSQMVWAKTYKIGCEIGNCNDKFTIVVCRYSPKGNVVGAKVYQPGKVLACENGVSQGNSALCAYPL